MLANIGLIAALGASAVIAGPVVSRQARNDCDILNYALTLEHLENTFYKQGLANYTAADFAAAGFDATFYKNLGEVAADEQTHVTVLSSAISSVCPCTVKQATYAFGVSTPASFVNLAATLEGVGVSAYLGAAKDISSATYLTIAGSILTVEARHSSFINAGLKKSPYPDPFDKPLSYNTVFSAAAKFITAFDPTDSCSAQLPFKAT